MVMRARPNVVPTQLRLDREARAMLDEYHAAVGGKLHEAAAAMIVGFYAEWKAAAAPLHDEDGECEECAYISGRYGPFGGAS